MFRGHSAFPEDPYLGPSTYSAASPVPEDLPPSLGWHGTMCMSHTNMHAGKSLIHMNRKISKIDLKQRSNVS